MITVFTPTYNRVYILATLYKSLCEQTYTDFEWLIVDDGSSDNTEFLVEKFISESVIDIHYFKVPNGGKHRAINFGVEKARGELFFIVDSDDHLTCNALERVMFYYNPIRNNEEFAGVSGLRIFPNGEIIGNGKSSFILIDCSRIDFAFKYKFSGDVAEVYKTEIMKRYPFPDYEGEKFCSEGVIWTRIALKYKLRFFEEGIYICEYLSDGLTYGKIRLYRNSPRYAMLVYKQGCMCKKYPWIWRIRYAVNYWRYTLCYRAKRPDELKLPLWAKIFWFIGALFYILDDIRLKR